MSFALKQLAPIAIRLDNVGPFQHDIPLEIEFLDKQKQPSNLFLLVSANGKGKTTILEAMAWLMGLLESEGFWDSDGNSIGEHLSARRLPPWLEDCAKARCQLDLFLEASMDGQSYSGVLSIAYARTDAADGGRFVQLLGTSSYPELNTSGTLLTWSILETRSTMTKNCTASSEHLPKSAADALLDGLLSQVRLASGQESHNPLFDPAERAPAVLYFLASRDLAPRTPNAERSIRKPAEWGHRLVRQFGRESGWENTLEGLLVWLDYVDEHGGRYEQAREIMERHVFAPGDGKVLDRIDRVLLAPILRQDRREHRFDRLSSGERNLAQIFLRIAAHMTRNTIVLIDEADLHLHPEWERMLIWSLKKLQRDWEQEGGPSVSFVFTCHSVDMITKFDFLGEEGSLRKGMWIIEDEDFKSTALESAPARG